MSYQIFVSFLLSSFNIFDFCVAGRNNIEFILTDKRLKENAVLYINIRVTIIHLPIRIRTMCKTQMLDCVMNQANILAVWRRRPKHDCVFLMFHFISLAECIQVYDSIVRQIVHAHIMHICVICRTLKNVI